MKLTRFSLKITLSVLAIATFAIAFNGYLNYAKFQKHLIQVEMSRMRFSADDIRANLEIGLRLGLPVKALANAQEIITFATSKDPTIISIEVFDHTGQSLFKAGKDGTLASSPENWRKSVIKKQKTIETLGADHFLLIAPLQSITEDFSGAMAIRYSREMHDKTMGEVFESLAPANLTAILLSVLIGTIGVHWLASKALRRVETIEQSLDIDHLENPAVPLQGNAGQLVSPAMAAARIAIQEIRDSEKSLKQ